MDVLGDSLMGGSSGMWGGDSEYWEQVWRKRAKIKVHLRGSMKTSHS